MSEYVINDIKSDMGYWYFGTFKKLTDTEPRAKLPEECEEFMNAITVEDQLDEAADILLVIGIQLLSQGCSLEDLLERTRHKINENIGRQWERKPDGTIHHV